MLNEHSIYFINELISKGSELSNSDSIAISRLAFSNPESIDDARNIFFSASPPAEPKERRVDIMGVFGNVWIRRLLFETSHSIHNGHKHHHDHVSLLATGSARVTVDGNISIFKAPTFIVIKAEKEHKIEALEDNTTWFCVFALRDEHGDVTDFYNGDNSPYGHVGVGVANNREQST